jgi:hypothetical protein
LAGAREFSLLQNIQIDPISWVVVVRGWRFEQLEYEAEHIPPSNA